jgi:hypothetical protein
MPTLSLIFAQLETDFLSLIPYENSLTLLNDTRIHSKEEEDEEGTTIIIHSRKFLKEYPLLVKVKTYIKSISSLPFS